MSTPLHGDHDSMQTSRAGHSTARHHWASRKRASPQATRTGYVSQHCECWPVNRLATASTSSRLAPSTPVTPGLPTLQSSYHDSTPTDLSLTNGSTPREARILLLGTGPGNSLLLIRLAHLLLTTCDLSSPSSPTSSSLLTSST
ncbi:hypothetical protein JCM10908_003857 [Rhodotorula pacifica]|uniref:uncharacterized protein n=1 Tax=Rhodotorula pacifica TaxID=1495444 RepID=UPI003173ADD5